MSLQNDRELIVWQKAMNLVVRIYELTRPFPDDERFGIISQLRRAGMSVPANMAEGYGRQHRGDYLRFVSIARGSVCELETLLVLAGRLKFATRDQLAEPWKLLQEVGKMLRGLRDSLSDSDRGQSKP